MLSYLPALLAWPLDLDCFEFTELLLGEVIEGSSYFTRLMLEASMNE